MDRSLSNRCPVTDSRSIPAAPLCMAVFIIQHTSPQGREEEVTKFTCPLQSANWIRHFCCRRITIGLLCSPKRTTLINNVTSTNLSRFSHFFHRRKVCINFRPFDVTDFGTNRKLICDFLLVINTNLPPILHRFRDKPVSTCPKSLHLVTPFTFLAPDRTEGFPWDDLHKILHGGQRMARVQNGVETLPKISTG